MAKGKTQTKSKPKSVTEKYAGLPSTAAKVRAMAADGMKTGAIAKALGISYQHAYNTVKRPVKNAA